MRIASDTVAADTGAANGIGRAVALELARRNAHIALIDVDSDGLDTLVNRLPASSKHVCDVSNDEAVKTASRAILAMHGKINLLINCAGIAVAGPLERLAIDDFEAAMGVNFWGQVHCCRAFLPHLHLAATQREGAVICNVLSVFALCVMPTKAAYAASKHAARAFTEVLGHEVRGPAFPCLQFILDRRRRISCSTGEPLMSHSVKRKRDFWRAACNPKGPLARSFVPSSTSAARTLIGYDTRIIDVAAACCSASLSGGSRRVPAVSSVLTPSSNATHSHVVLE